MSQSKHGGNATETEKDALFMLRLQELDQIGIAYLRGILFKLVLHADGSLLDDEEREAIDGLFVTLNWAE